MRQRGQGLPVLIRDDVRSRRPAVDDANDEVDEGAPHVQARHVGLAAGLAEGVLEQEGQELVDRELVTVLKPAQVRPNE